jgi:hypothetical protein
LLITNKGEIMARKPKETASLEPDPNNAIPRIALGEIGVSGLRVSNKQIYAERNKLFQWPNILRIVHEMSAHPTVASAFNVYNLMINSVPWCVCPPEGATDKELERTKFVESCMYDMEHSWAQFITDVSTYVKYGFSINEKVWRRRLKKNGSKFNDGKIGLRKLPPRSQETVQKWYFSEDGRDLIAVGQSLENIEQPWRFEKLKNEDGVLRIERNKFLLFSADSTNGNPQGQSLLKPVFLPYKQLSLLQDQLMLGISKDLQGIPCIGIPANLLSATASDADKQSAAQFVEMANNLVKGTQSGIVYPLMKDENGNPTIEIKLLEAKYGKSFNIPEVIASLQTDILVALGVDVIKLGANQQGSYSLASSKENLLSMTIEYRLKEIKAVLNQDLMRSIYEMNGWDTDRMAQFDYGNILDEDLEEISKYIQRTKSVGILPRTLDTVNKALTSLGLPALPEGTELSDSMFPDSASRAGDGMAKGSGNGTSDNPASQDNSSNNSDNKA